MKFANMSLFLFLPFGHTTQIRILFIFADELRSDDEAKSISKAMNLTLSAFYVFRYFLAWK